jgi:hypothetical protein
MRTFRLPALLLLTLGCTPKGPPALLDPRLRGEVLCLYRGAPFSSEALLLVPERGTPFARAGAPSGRAPLVTGRLRQAQERVVFEGVFEGQGLHLDADVDATEGAVLEAREPVRFGPLVFAPLGAGLRVARGTPGHVEVRVDQALLEAFSPVGALPVISLGCEATRLLAPLGPEQALATDAALERTAQTPRRQLVGPGRVPVSATPGGPPMGSFTPPAAGLPVWILSTTGLEARVVYQSREGAAVVGFVPQSALRPAAEVDAGPTEAWSRAYQRLARGSGALEAPRPPDHACGSTETLFVTVGDDTVHVGRLGASTPFSLHGAAGLGLVAVGFEESWLHVLPQARLTLAANAADCPEQHTP